MIINRTKKLYRIYQLLGNPSAYICFLNNKQHGKKIYIDVNKEIECVELYYKGLLHRINKPVSIKWQYCVTHTNWRTKGYIYGHQYSLISHHRSVIDFSRYEPDSFGMFYEPYKKLHRNKYDVRLTLYHQS